MEISEAIEKLKEMKENCRYKTYVPNEQRDEWKQESQAIDTVLEELDKLQKENKNLKAENRILSVKLAEYFSDNNLCEKGCKYCESEKDKE